MLYVGRCDTWAYVTNMIKSANIINNPEKVYIQVGMNVIEKPDFDIDHFLANFETALHLVKEKFANTVIVVSSIPPRKDRSVKAINDRICDLVDVLPKVTFMSNQAITEDMLQDRKHLNKEGFSTLLGNIRYMLFENLPEFRHWRSKPNDHTRKNRNQQYHENRSGQYNQSNWTNTNESRYPHGDYELSRNFSGTDFGNYQPFWNSV